MDSPATDARARFDIVPPHLAVTAMRDNGYKNAAYALAELIDNSFQAGATQVELLCGERTERVSERTRRRIHTVGVLDNGRGMDAGVLQLALQFGNGTHLDAASQKGIGKFGMGLPSSSVSQCTRVDVWSWTDGVESALWTYLDVNEIAGRTMTEVPAPTPNPVPDLWRTVGQRFGPTGTLVVWSDLDRVVWKTAASIIRNSEFLIGRMYRRFLADGRAAIRMLAFDADRPAEGPAESYAKPNDPLYLTAGTSCPAPYGVEPMFEPHGAPWVVPIEHGGASHDVTVRWAVAREHARSKPMAGATAYGKHAARNIGVSVVRAGRELELNESWAVQYDPRERWWGIEVEFPPALDEVFGVTNNKQSARNFHQIQHADVAEEDETTQQMITRIEEDDPARAKLFEISLRIDRTLNDTIRPNIKAQTKGNRTAKAPGRHDDHSPEARATAATKERQDEGRAGASDDGEDRPAAERAADIETNLIESHVTAERAREVAEEVTQRGLKYKIVEARVQTPAFFTVEPEAGVILVKLNTDHPAYDNLVEVLDADTDGLDADALRERLANARDGLRLLLLAWARYEDEATDAEREAAQDARYGWGRVAGRFLQIND